MVAEIEGAFSGLTIQQLYQLCHDDLATAKQHQGYREEVILESKQGPTVIVGGRRIIMLGSNNYLGLANHPRILQAAHKAIDQYGYGLASVSVLSGTQSIHKQLEKRIGKFVGCEDALLFPSCFMANTGFFEAILSNSFDYSQYKDIIYTDSCNHPSIFYGLKVALANNDDQLECLAFHNNDMSHLGSLLQKANGEQHRISIIATSGVFFTEGEMTKLNSLLELRDKYQALLYVDDSHGTGVLGVNGRGTAEEQGVLGKPDLISGTFGKALGGASGGFIAGRADLIDYLRQRTGTFIFTNSIPPPVVCASLEALNMLEEDNSLLESLRHNTKYFRTILTELGFSISTANHPTILTMVGEDNLAKQMSAELLHAGVYCREIRYPVVPKGKARLRMQISAAHSKEELDSAAEAIASVGRKFKLI